MKDISVTQRGWTLDVLNIVRRLVDGRRRGDESGSAAGKRPSLLTSTLRSTATEDGSVPTAGTFNNDEVGDEVTSPGAQFQKRASLRTSTLRSTATEDGSAPTGEFTTTDDG